MRNVLERGAIAARVATDGGSCRWGRTRARILGRCVAGLLLLGTATVSAQTVELSVEGPATVTENSTFDASVVLDLGGFDPSGGWSFGVCNDVASVTLLSSELGATTQTVNNGLPPDFIQTNEFPEGYTQGVVISFGITSLFPGSDYQLAVGHYSAGLETPATSIVICSTLGAPPVNSVVVINGASVLPAFVDLAVEIEGIPDPSFTSRLPDMIALHPPLGGSTVVDVAVEIDQDDNGAPEALTQGLSCGVAHDPAFLDVVAVTLGPVLAAMTGGAGPGFIQIGLGDPHGWTCGVVYDLTGGILVPLQDAHVLTATYETVPGALDGGFGSTTVPLTFSNAIGTPAVENVVVVGGASLAPNFSDGSIEFVVIEDPLFVRGDANGDILVNIADGIFILNALFQGGPFLGCAEAGDANDDGLLDASDAAFIFNHRFGGGPPPPAPYPGCGIDGSGNVTDCDTPGPC